MELQSDAPWSPVFENWKYAEAGTKKSGTIECELYTDATIYGEAELGPIRFINTIAHATPAISSTKRAVVVRLSCYWPDDLPAYRSPRKSSYEHYHGGDMLDEVAALTSLALGIKVQAGPVTREFKNDGDPYGTPIAYYSKAIPVLLAPQSRNRLLRASETANLTDLLCLGGLSNVSRDDANAILKAARLYQQGLWIAESNPALAWVLLVSSIEAAANHWAKSNAITIDKADLPDPIAEAVRELGEPDALVSALNSFFLKHTKATQKFIGFVLEHKPAPPPVRPEADRLKLDYSTNELGRVLKIIYTHRSNSLHSGIPFPHPMCQPPFLDPPEETFFALAASSQNAIWEAKDVPMLLHTFEYITRGTLLRWIKALIVAAPRQKSSVGQ